MTSFSLVLQCHIPRHDLPGEGFLSFSYFFISRLGLLTDELNQHRVDWAVANKTILQYLVIKILTDLRVQRGEYFFLYLENF